MKLLEEHCILTDMQHGFRAKRSRVTQPIYTIIEVTKFLDDGTSVHAVILDFKEAFDKVPHQ